MFRPEDMEHVRVFVPLSAQERVMSDLHEDGLCQIDAGDDDSDVMRFSRYLSRVIARLERYKKGKVLPKAGVVREGNWFSTVQKDVTKIHDKSIAHIQTIKQSQHDIQLSQKVVETLKLLPDVRTNFYTATDLLQVEVGVIPIDEKVSDANFVYATNRISKDEALLVAIGLQSQNISKKLFTHGFKRLDVEASSKKPNQLITLHEKKIKTCESQITKSREALQKMANAKLPQLYLYAEEITIEQNRLQGINANEKYDSFVSFQAWVPQSQKKDFEAVVKRGAKSYVIEAVDATNHDDAPTLLANRNVIKPFEIITKLYSVPKNGKFDPTFFIAISFPLFFGLMLTDFVYGLALTILATVLFRRAHKGDEGMRGFSALLIISGLVTMAMGILFGSYFGNFFQMMGVNVPLLLDSMKDIIPMIAIVLTLGILHITLGLVIGFVEYVKEGRIRRALSEQGVWLLFVASVVAFLIPISGAIFVGIILLSLSVFMQFFFTMRKDGAINAVLSLFNYSGFMGDVFSYIRLMALAIGTSGIALAVNFMAVLAFDLIPGVGIVFAILVFIVGHVFNLVMNGLGAFIHTLRLHFLEHFSKYYDGGGKEYTPYYAKRKYTTNTYLRR